MSNQLFNPSFEQNLSKILEMKNELTNKCMLKVRQRQKVDHTDLLPLQTKPDNIEKINFGIEKMKKTTLYMFTYFFFSTLFAIKQTLKFRKLKVGIRPSLKTWAFTFFSACFLAKIFEGRLEGSFTESIEDMTVEYVFELNQLNESEKSKTKKLCKNALDYYKNFNYKVK
jgi:hypothetical protein